MTSPGSLAELLLLLNNAGVTEYAEDTAPDGTKRLALKLAGSGARTHETLHRLPVAAPERATPPHDDIDLALNGPPPGALGGD